MPFQRTIAQRISCTGTGLHSGAPVSLALLPAEPDTGIVFVARGDAGPVEIPARLERVASTENATSLARDGARVATVEHLLAALRGLCVDNLRVELDAPELPAMDGSAASFVHLLQRAGLQPQSVPRRVIAVARCVTYDDGLRSIRFEPTRRGLQLSCAIDFAHPAIGRQELALAELTPAVFETQLARARTFGFFDQVEALRAAGLARGASLENTVVLDAHGVMNPGGLRWPDEFVRHKLLDLLGDLALLGHPLQGHVRVERGGHALHRAGMDALLAARDAWRLVDDPPRASAAAAGAAEHASPSQAG